METGYIDKIDMTEEGSTVTYNIKDTTSGYITRTVNNLANYTDNTILARDYQAKLIAGGNITIDGVEISATDTTYNPATTTANGLMSASDKARLDTMSNGAEPNDITTIKRNGITLLPTNREVNIEVPITSITLNGVTQAPVGGEVSLTTIADVQIGVSSQSTGTSIISNGIAKLVTNSVYNADSNKIATMQDIPTVPGVIVANVLVNGTSVVNNQVANLVTNSSYHATDNKIATMLDIQNNIIQYEEMPVASISLINKIIQYTGTTGTYTQGYFYQCVSDEAEEPTYGWARIDTQPSGGSGGDTTDVQINGYSITANNIADIITESSYDAESNKIATMEDIPTLVQSDWNEADSGSLAYIQNKPNLSQYLTAAYFTTITGYVATATQTLKNVNGTLTWVTDTI